MEMNYCNFRCCNQFKIYLLEQVNGCNGLEVLQYSGKRARNPFFNLPKVWPKFDPLSRSDQITSLRLGLKLISTYFMLRIPFHVIWFHSKREN